MKLTEMVHQVVLAFEPKRHPVPALIALAMMLTAIVALVAMGGSGASGLAKLAPSIVQRLTWV